MLINRRNAKKISKIVEKRLNKEYRNGAYFYIEKLEVQLEDCIGCDDLYCRAGYEIYSNGVSTGAYHTIRFKFGISGVVKSIKECAAVLAVHAMNKLDEYDSFEDLD